MSPDPKGYVDSSNLYAFAGGDPVNGRDPKGQQVRSDSKDLPRNYRAPVVAVKPDDPADARRREMVACVGDALVERGKGTALGSVPGVATASTLTRLVDHASDVVEAASNDGVAAAATAAWDAYTDELSHLPVARWAHPATAASDAQVAKDACKEAASRTDLALDVMEDTALIVGAVEVARTPRSVTRRTDSTAITKYDPVLAWRQGSPVTTLVPDSYVVVRGGIQPIPAPGTTISGSAGPTLADAGAGVPHGKLRATTAGQIRARGGTVEFKPERSKTGEMNNRHVNIVERAATAFGELIENPGKKSSKR